MKTQIPAQENFRHMGVIKKTDLHTRVPNLQKKTKKGQSQNQRRRSTSASTRASKKKKVENSFTGESKAGGIDGHVEEGCVDGVAYRSQESGGEGSQVMTRRCRAEKEGGNSFGHNRIGQRAEMKKEFRAAQGKK